MQGGVILVTQPDIIIGIDAGTSVIKAVAFEMNGRQVAAASVKNTYAVDQDGAATQCMTRTWADCTRSLKKLGERVENLAARTVALSVTGQGDGTWLLDSAGAPVSDAWLWLDARAASTVDRLVGGPLENDRFAATGTGLNTCQQGAQLAHMMAHCPALLDQAATAFHCKDWLYFNLTGQRATDPSEASFTFGNFRTRRYDDTVISALGLSKKRHLLPDIIDGTQTTHALTAEAAQLTGLLQGTPVSLGFVDMIMTGFGAGVYTGQPGVACSAIGSTGVHMKATQANDVVLGADHTGYVLCLPCPDIVAQTQTNMAATLNIDWLLNLAADLIADFGPAPSHNDLINKIDTWVDQSDPATLLYLPYISEAGERGPFINAHAQAGFTGVLANHRFPDLVRSVVESLGMATRDCYSAMGELPRELRVTGGAARSASLRNILAASLNTPVRVSMREEAGAAGCAMMAAVAVGAFDTMDDCIATWVTPLLGKAETADANLAQTYDSLFASYKETRTAMQPTWPVMTRQMHRDGQI